METNNSNKSRIGDIVELKAQAWLLDQGYEVFRNVSSRGPMDLLAVDTNGNVINVDVKKAVDRNRKIVKVYKRKKTELQDALNVQFLYYDEKHNVFAWDIGEIRQLNNLPTSTPSPKQKPQSVIQSEFGSMAEIARFYDVHPRSLRERLRKGEAIDSAIAALKRNSKVVKVNGIQFLNKQAVCDHFELSRGTLDYWIYEKRVTLNDAVNNMLEKKENKK